MDTFAPLPAEELYTSPPAPPEQSYGSLNLAVDAMQDFARAHNYAMVLKRSKPDGRDVIKTKHIYACDRQTSYTSTASVRLTASRATGCRFQLKIVTG
jgi:hypothetical protein